MSIKLYSYWRSSCSWRVRICLALKGVDYQYIPVHLVKDGGEQKKPEYIEVNPMAQVPTLVHGDLVLTQSMAIMEYLEETFPGHPLLPKETQKRAKVRELCEIVNAGIQPLQNLSVLRKIGDNSQEWAKDVITTGFVSLERHLTKCAGKYCVGDDITIADACLVPQVMNANRFKVSMDQFPSIERVNKALLEHDAFIVSSPPKQPDGQ